MFVPPPPQDSVSPNYSKPPSPRMTKSPSLTRQNGVRGLQNLDQISQSPPLLASPSASQRPSENGEGLEMQEMRGEPLAKRRDSFERTYLESLPRIDVQHKRQRSQYSNSNPSTPESPISPLLTSDPQEERSHSKTFSRSLSQTIELQQMSDDMGNAETITLGRLAKLSSPEWFCALLGSCGACLFGSFNPLFALLLVQVAETYSYTSKKVMWHEVSKWCLLVAGMGLATVVLNFLQHFYFGIMGEKMTERVRRLMFSGERFPYPNRFSLLFLRFIPPSAHSAALVRERVFFGS